MKNLLWFVLEVWAGAQVRKIKLSECWKNQVFWGICCISSFNIFFYLNCFLWFMSWCSKGLLAPWGWDVGSTRGSLGIARARVCPSLGVGQPTAPGQPQHRHLWLSPWLGWGWMRSWAPGRAGGALGWARTLRTGDTLGVTHYWQCADTFSDFQYSVIFERQMHV